MKQKDFDFIQHKFEQAQPPLPDGLRAECLKQRILKKESHKVMQCLSELHGTKHGQ